MRRKSWRPRSTVQPSHISIGLPILSVTRRSATRLPLTKLPHPEPQSLPPASPAPPLTHGPFIGRYRWAHASSWQRRGSRAHTLSTGSHTDTGATALKPVSALVPAVPL